MSKYNNSLIAILFILCVSCTNEDTKIRKALLFSIPEPVRSEYQYDSHILLETLLKSNLTDSISSLRAIIATNETLIQMDSVRLADIQNCIDECITLRSNTIYFLRPSYDEIIDDYEDMAADIIERIEDNQNEISFCESKIKYLSNAMDETESPIVFYKVKHAYKMYGMHRDTIVYVNSKYEIIR